MTSVMAVEVAPDLKTCKAYISVLGNQEAQEETMAGLKSAESYVRRQLARNLNLRNTPEIRFLLDQSIEYGVHMSKADRWGGKKGCFWDGDRGIKVSIMNRIADILENIKTVGIAGHVRPDGDCVGSCMGLYLYLKEWYPQIEAVFI